MVQNISQRAKQDKQFLMILDLVKIIKGFIP